MKHIAIITCAELPCLCKDDQLLLKKLQEYSEEITVSVYIWDRDEIPNGSIVIVRNTWDYVSKYQNFFEWLNTLPQRNIAVFNDVKTICWNSNKKYLLELEAKGVPIVPSVLLQMENKSNVNHVFGIMETHEWNVAVVKGCIGAGAYRVMRISKQDSSNTAKIKELQGILNEVDVIVQPYFSSIVDKG